jgi:outer membrane cobalamin receptor
MCKIVVSLMVFLAAVQSLWPQAQGSSRGAIAGWVVDRDARHPLSGVNITVEGTQLGAVSDREGAFVMSKLRAGTYTLTFRRIGYAAVRSDPVIVSAGDTVHLGEIAMAEAAIPLKEVVVSPGSYALMGTEPSRQTLTQEDIKMLGWAEDITRAIQKVPGVSGNDLAAKFYIRGGDVDEVRVELDGIQIYKPYHQKDFGGGLSSTIDAEAIEGVDFQTGGYTAEYGDRMSGVLSLRTKRPQAGRASQTSVGLSLINARGFSMGRFNNDRTSWLVSARRGYLDLLNRFTGNEWKLTPTYFDVLGKLEHTVSSRHVWSGHVFLSRDTYNLDEKEFEPGKTVPNIDFSDTYYGSYYGWTTLQSTFTPTVHARSLLYGGIVTQRRFWDNFDDDPNAHYTKTTLFDDRDWRLFGFRQDWSVEADNNVFLKLGIDVKRSTVDFEYSKDIDQEFLTADSTLVRRTDRFDANTTRKGTQAALYGSVRFRVLEPFTIETGLRYDHASYADDRLWSPRVNAVYALGRNTNLRSGWGYFYQSQGIDELRVQFEELSPQPARKAEHYVIGLEHRFENSLYLRTEGYYKRLSRVPVRYITLGGDIDEFYPEARTDLVRVTADEGAAKGAEVYLKYDSGGQWSWWFSYAVSEAKDHVTAVDYGGRLIERTGWLPRPWDQRHTLNADVYYRLSRSWHFNAAWQYRSGWPFTNFDVVRVQRADGTFAYFHDFGRLSGSTYPSYQRLDVRINRHFHTSKGKITLFLHVINVLNHENVSGYDHDVDTADATGFVAPVDAETWLGLTPFAGVIWEF